MAQQRVIALHGNVIIDLDGFKEVNTVHGHAGGDAALVAAAGAMRRTVREGDLVARLGGDEFAVVAPSLGHETLTELGQRLVASVKAASAALELDGVRLSASAGCAVIPDDAQTVDEALALADRGLREGKDRLVVGGRAG